MIDEVPAHLHVAADEAARAEIDAMLGRVIRVVMKYAFFENMLTSPLKCRKPPLAVCSFDVPEGIVVKHRGRIAVRCSTAHATTVDCLDSVDVCC